MPSPCTGSIAAAMNCVWTLWNFGSFAMPEDELKAKNSSPWHMRALSAAIAEVAASWRELFAHESVTEKCAPPRARPRVRVGSYQYTRARRPTRAQRP